MSSEVKTNKISPATGTAFTLGDSGDTFTVPSGVTITNSGTATGFGGNNTPAFHAYRSSGSQSIAHDTKTKLEINAEWFDTDGAYDHTTNYRITVPSGEVASISFLLVFTQIVKLTVHWQHFQQSFMLMVVPNHCMILVTTLVILEKQRMRSLLS